MALSKYIEIEEVDSDEFESLKSDSRNKELITVLKQFITTLQNDNSLKDFIERNITTLGLLEEKVSELSKQETPNVNVNVDINELRNDVRENTEQIKKMIELMNIKPTRLKVIRWSNQLTNYIDIEYTSLPK